MSCIGDYSNGSQDFTSCHSPCLGNGLLRIVLRSRTGKPSGLSLDVGLVPAQVAMSAYQVTGADKVAETMHLPKWWASHRLCSGH